MGCCTSVEQSQVGMIESCGRYTRTATAGFNWLNPFACERVAGTISLRIQQLDVTVETKSRDNVFVHIVVSVQYQAIWDNIYDAFYKLSNPHEQIRAFVFDVVRAEVPKIDLDEIFVTKDDIAIAIKDELTKVMEEFGYELLKTLITDIQPDQKVKDAMNDINAAQRLKYAAADKAEAQKIAIVKSAEAEAESKYLAGVGIARQRMAIIDGLRDSVVNFSKGVEGADSKDVMDLVLVTQYFDTLKDIGARPGSNAVFVPFEGTTGVGNIADQIRTGFLQSEAADLNRLHHHGQRNPHHPHHQ